MRDRADKPTGPPRRNPRGGKGGAEPRRVIRRREHQVLTLTEQGWRQEAIADHLGITQAAVSKILRRVDERALRVVADQVAYPQDARRAPPGIPQPRGTTGLGAEQTGAGPAAPDQGRPG